MGEEQSPSTTKFWQQQSALGGGRDRFPEWMLLAELVLVMVPTSVGDERMFSTMKCMRNPQRRLLKQEHRAVTSQRVTSQRVQGGSRASSVWGLSPTQRPMGRGWMRAQHGRNG